MHQLCRRMHHHFGPLLYRPAWSQSTVWGEMYSVSYYVELYHVRLLPVVSWILCVPTYIQSATVRAYLDWVCYCIALFVLILLLCRATCTQSVTVWDYLYSVCNCMGLLVPSLQHEGHAWMLRCYLRVSSIYNNQYIRHGYGSVRYINMIFKQLDISP